jgi:hypothetical protein
MSAAPAALWWGLGLMLLGAAAWALVARPKVRFILVHEDEFSEGFYYQLLQFPITVGAEASNDIVLRHPEVSRRHLELRKAWRGVALRDLDSTNGTTVNGESVREALLQHDDRIVLGEVIQLRFEDQSRGT